MSKFVKIGEVDRVIDIAIKCYRELLEDVTHDENKLFYKGKIESMETLKKNIHNYTIQYELNDEEIA